MSIGLLGDLAFNGLISEEGKIQERYADIAKHLNKIDLVFANLETPVFAGETRNANEKIILFSDYEITKEALQFLNIKCVISRVTIANNEDTIVKRIVKGIEYPIIVASSILIK